MAYDPLGSLIVVSGMAFEAAIAKGGGVRTVYGLDTSRLIADIERELKEGTRGIVSFGVAAGLMASLSAGAIVVARTIVYKQERFTADNGFSAGLLRYLPDALHADIAAVDLPLNSTEEKISLWENTRAAIADMESYHAARMAASYGVPFVAVRVVLDSAARALPHAAQVSAKPDGTIDYGRLLMSLLKEPGQLKDMMSLANDHRKAKSALLRCSRLLKRGRFGINDIR